MEQPKGTLFVSIPTLLDPSLAPPDTHIFHAFTPDWIEGYQVHSPSALTMQPVMRLGSQSPGSSGARPDSSCGVHRPSPPRTTRLPRRLRQTT